MNNLIQNMRLKSMSGLFFFALSAFFAPSASATELMCTRSLSQSIDPYYRIQFNTPRLRIAHLYNDPTKIDGMNIVHNKKMITMKSKLSEPEMNSFWLNESPTEEDILTFVSNMDSIVYQARAHVLFHSAIYDKRTNELVGAFNLTIIPRLNKFTLAVASKQITFALAIFPEFQRQGFADEIVKSVITHFTERPPYTSIQVIVLDSNSASLELFKKNGFNKLSKKDPKENFTRLELSPIRLNSSSGVIL